MFSGECPTDANYQYVASADVCYKPVTTERLSWGNASQACQADGGHLYIANTPKKMAVVTDFITTNGG